MGNERETDQPSENPALKSGNKTCLMMKEGLAPNLKWIKGFFAALIPNLELTGDVIKAWEKAPDKAALRKTIEQRLEFVTKLRGTILTSQQQAGENALQFFILFEQDPFIVSQGIKTNYTGFFNTIAIAGIWKDSFTVQRDHLLRLAALLYDFEKGFEYELRLMDQLEEAETPAAPPEEPKRIVPMVTEVRKALVKKLPPAPPPAPTLRSNVERIFLLDPRKTTLLLRAAKFRSSKGMSFQPKLLAELVRRLGLELPFVESDLENMVPLRDKRHFIFILQDKTQWIYNSLHNTWMSYSEQLEGRIADIAALEIHNPEDDSSLQEFQIPTWIPPIPNYCQEYSLWLGQEQVECFSKWQGELCVSIVVRYVGNKKNFHRYFLRYDVFQSRWNLEDESEASDGVFYR